MKISIKPLHILLITSIAHIRYNSNDIKSLGRDFLALSMIKFQIKPRTITKLHMQIQFFILVNKKKSLRATDFPFHAHSFALVTSGVRAKCINLSGNFNKL